MSCVLRKYCYKNNYGVYKKSVGMFLVIIKYCDFFYAKQQIVDINQNKIH